jgi:hypothetical protein
MTQKKWANELNCAFSKEDVQMARNHVKKCSTSLTTEDIQLKITLRFYLTSVGIATTKNTNKKRWQGCGGKGILIHYWWECKLVQSLWNWSTSS